MCTRHTLCRGTNRAHIIGTISTDRVIKLVDFSLGALCADTSIIGTLRTICTTLHTVVLPIIIIPGITSKSCFDTRSILFIPSYFTSTGPITFHNKARCALRAHTSWRRANITIGRACQALGAIKVFVRVCAYVATTVCTHVPIAFAHTIRQGVGRIASGASDHV